VEEDAPVEEEKPFHPDNRLALPPEYNKYEKVSPKSSEAEEENAENLATGIPRFLLADTIAKTVEKPQPQRKPEQKLELSGFQQEKVTSTVDGNLPSTLKEILERLSPEWETENPFVSFCKQAEPQLLMGTAGLIEQARQSQLSDKKDKMFTIPGFDITVFLMAEKGDALRAWDRKENIGAIMYMQNKTTWNVLYLGYNVSGKLLQAEEQAIRYEDFSQSDWKYAVNLGDRILEKKRMR